MLKLGNILDRLVGKIAPFRFYLTLGAFAVLLALLAVQTVRIEGFKVWPLSVEGWKPKAERFERDLSNVRQAQALAKAKAKQARLEQEARYRALAERIDGDAQRKTSAYMGDAERFIAAGGLRSKVFGGHGIGPGTGPQGESAGDTERAGSPPVMDEGYVTVTTDDVRICTINTVKAEAAREWALSLDPD